MKKLLVLLMGLTILISCRKGEIFDVDTTMKASIVNSDAIMSLKTINARKTSYSKLLKPEEKYLFVQNRLTETVSDLLLDEEQATVLNDLKRFLKPELYVDGSKLQKEFMRYEPSWRNKASKIIGKDHLRYLFSFMTLDEYKTIISKKKVPNALRALGECTCSTASDWCSDPTACLESLICNHTPNGCGTLYLYSCVGDCEVF